jgi:hypothetical protein
MSKVVMLVVLRTSNVSYVIFIVAPCILKIHKLSKTKKCTNTSCIILKHTLKHLKGSYMFRSIDHPQGAHAVPC